MSTRRALAIAAATLLIGAAAGRYSAPTRIEERTVYAEREQERIAWQWKADEQRTADTKTKTIVVTRWRTTPAGPEVTREETTAADTHEESKATATAVRVEYRDRIVHATSERIVNREAPVWRVALSAGSTWPLAPVYAVEASRVVLGPLDAGLRVATDRTANLVVGVRW